MLSFDWVLASNGGHEFIIAIVILAAGVVGTGVVIALINRANNDLVELTPEENEKHLEKLQEEAIILQKNWTEAKRTLYLGPINPHMICPHCQTKGTVRTIHSSMKKGISGAKATAALITGGLSVLATGLGGGDTALYRSNNGFFAKHFVFGC